MSAMTMLNIASLRRKEASGRRPRRYVDECLRLGVVDEQHDVLILSRGAMAYLLSKYRDGRHDVQPPDEPTPPARGLGDTVAKLTKAVGIRPCGGCAKRRDKLNRLVPYRRPPRAE